MQEGQVVCYESRKLNEHEQNYPSHDLELTTITHTLKMWRHYLQVAGLIHVVANQRTAVREDSGLDLGVTWSKGLCIGLGNFVK